jgi:nucleotide-binding universal stress UspA family protein
VADRAPQVSTLRRTQRSGPQQASRRVTTYRRILVPLADSKEPSHAIDFACQLAAEHHASLIALTVIEVPMMVPMDAHMIAEEAAAHQLLEEARAAAHGYQIGFSARVVRARDAGEAIVQTAIQYNPEIIILSAKRKQKSSGRTPPFGRTVRFVLTHSPCRVMVATLPQARRA